VRVISVAVLIYISFKQSTAKRALRVVQPVPAHNG
jgi:hypothetical protein